MSGSDPSPLPRVWEERQRYKRLVKWAWWKFGARDALPNVRVAAAQPDCHRRLKDGGRVAKRTESIRRVHKKVGRCLKIVWGSGFLMGRDGKVHTHRRMGCGSQFGADHVVDVLRRAEGDGKRLLSNGARRGEKAVEEIKDAGEGRPSFAETPSHRLLDS